MLNGNQQGWLCPVRTSVAASLPRGDTTPPRGVNTWCERCPRPRPRLPAPPKVQAPPYLLHRAIRRRTHHAAAVASCVIWRQEPAALGQGFIAATAGPRVRAIGAGEATPAWGARPPGSGGPTAERARHVRECPPGGACGGLPARVLRTFFIMFRRVRVGPPRAAACRGRGRPCSGPAIRC